MLPIFSSLLTPVLRPLMIRRMRFNQSEIEGVVFKIADTLEEKTAAFKLVHEMYVRRGIIPASEKNWRLSVFHLLPTTTIFVAKSGDRIIGSVSLIEDSPLGVPMEETHPKEILSLRLAGLRFAEVGALAVTQERRGKGVSLMLYNILLRWARQYRLIRNLAIAVHPRIEKFFSVIFLFKRMGPVHSYKKLNCAPSVPLCVDLSTGLKQFRAIYDRPDMHIGLSRHSANVYRFFCEEWEANLCLPQRSPFMPCLQSPPIWGPDELMWILRKGGVRPADLPRQQRRVLTKYYSSLPDPSMHTLRQEVC
ncbi:GNAT family N-acetyltransferase [Undibacterium crateris]|uniref:GNAT family N-acetyltransferase n=1 Tax=Undibacterium crateris TaxID=2528175 RepID=UPI001389712E|nr:GNAT family N-acetyltransferase [Undibacterium crateris]NDI86353.1 GNAT family N-acetyltransferase [Undibacterium crateris]